MPSFAPIKRAEFIKALRKAGFEGPYSGGKYQFMQRGIIRLRIPNPHESDISRDLLARLLKQADISREEWQGL